MMNCLEKKKRLIFPLSLMTLSFICWAVHSSISCSVRNWYESTKLTYPLPAPPVTHYFIRSWFVEVGSVSN